MRIKVVIKYDGSKFNGFQRLLDDKRSVQFEVEKALSKIYNRNIEIKGSGRTDAGVHANYQVFHFDAKTIKKDLKKDLNEKLLPDIYVKKIRKVSDDFHARRSVKKKKYIYKINLGPYKSSLNGYYYQPKFKLDISLMKDAAKYLIGTHDFHNFVSGEREDYVTTIFAINFIKSFDKLEIEFIGKGFYRYMVRNLVGALVEVGKCKESYKTVENMINHPEITKNLSTAPAEGLYLQKIWY